MPLEREAALAKAAEARRQRRELLNQIAGGRVGLPEVLGRTDNVARKTRVVQLLRALPGYGPTRTAKAMEAAGIDTRRRVGGLGNQQRQTLTSIVTQ